MDVVDDVPTPGSTATMFKLFVYGMLAVPMSMILMLMLPRIISSRIGTAFCNLVFNKLKIGHIKFWYVLFAIACFFLIGSVNGSLKREKLYASARRDTQVSVGRINQLKLEKFKEERDFWLWLFTVTLWVVAARMNVYLKQIRKLRKKIQTLTKAPVTPRVDETTDEEYIDE
eukprot:TRINITY_DN170224_c0_g4_i1.p1 TRINITY_DN170224_c0_g4~~TRINITY_DN170224_c0_g4_i1.p1  ORF type:complete len:172 (+),score=44.59 TRINITY_DN170224_c0_g4_i1:36-551(+)